MVVPFADRLCHLFRHYTGVVAAYGLAVVEVAPVELTLQVLVPAFFIGTLCFMLSTIIKNGNGTAVVIIIIGLIFFIMRNTLGASKWNVFLNPFDLPLDKNPAVFYSIVLSNRIILLIASVICLLTGLYQTQNRERFI